MWEGRLETDLGVPSGSDERVKNGTLGRGNPRPKEEGWPEVGSNLGVGWGCLDSHVTSGVRTLHPGIPGCGT